MTRPARRDVARLAAAGLCAAVLCACSTNRPVVPAATPPAVGPAPAPAASALPAGDDWRSLPPVPFGSTVSQIPFAVNEVLLFQGEARGAEPDEQECFSDSGAPFHLRGIEADDYVLCFFHDRFYRVEAVIRLPKDAPPDTFTRWCEEWLAGLSDPQRNADQCAGRDQDTVFEAGLAYDTEIAGPLLTVVVADQPTRDIYEQRQKQRTEKNPPPPKP